MIPPPSLPLPQKGGNPSYSNYKQSLDILVVFEKSCGKVSKQNDSAKGDFFSSYVHP